MESEKSKILIIGVTGRLGFELAKASLNSLHPTFGLVRDSAFSDPHKSQKLHFLSGAGVTLIKGSLQDEDILVEALKQVDVRFLPSEFGSDPDRTRISDLDHNFYSRKSEIRRLIEAEGIPYTYVCCNFFTSFFLLSLVQPGRKNPPRDEVSIFGDGTAKAVFVKENDAAAFAINTVDDLRTLNKVVHLRPPGNVYSMNELVDIWEGKIGKTLKRNYITEDELLKKIREMPYPENMELVFIYSAFVKGDQTYFSIDSSGGLEGTQLYPQITYTTISEFLDTLL
uniref:Probable pinoresinol-lariciresinol reductase 3 isoform X2 n=1 Tax=Nicotiana tabacum TaxID=4097 RepID=A0A1S4AF27_TOBAC|nr:PREDICTED: probable pinoresinol-lariciresinol reductase 3 isoform X2 [Nicotiana tabacum]